MARLGAPSEELIAAMEELGLQGWIPGGRARTLRRRTERRAATQSTAMVPEMGAVELMLRGAATPAQIARAAGAVGAVGAGVVVASAIVGIAAASRSPWVRGLALVGALVCGL